MADFSNDSAQVSTYFTTNLSDASYSSAGGEFNQDFSSVQTLLINKFGQLGYEPYMSWSETVFLQREVLDDNDGSYEIYISYADVNNDQWSIELTPIPAPIQLPWRANLETFKKQPFYKNGDATQTRSVYQLAQQQYGEYTIYLQPDPAITAGQVATTIYIHINVRLALEIGQTVLKTYFFEYYSYDNTLFPNDPLSVIPIQLPYWLRWPYWAQQIAATENLSLATWTPSLGGWPLSTTPARQFLSRNNQALCAMDNAPPTGTPQCLFQVEVSALNPSYVGNQSTGQIMTTAMFEAGQPNSNAVTIKSNYYQQTWQQATNMIGKAILQYRITDRFGKPFISLIANYDITTKINIENRRRKNMFNNM
jgi:hypothetical protein